MCTKTTYFVLKIVNENVLGISVGTKANYKLKKYPISCNMSYQTKKILPKREITSFQRVCIFISLAFREHFHIY